jgi:hypothetical protein
MVGNRGDLVYSRNDYDIEFEFQVIEIKKYNK